MACVGVDVKDVASSVTCAVSCAPTSAVDVATALPRTDSFECTSLTTPPAVLRPLSSPDSLGVIVAADVANTSPKPVSFAFGPFAIAVDVPTPLVSPAHCTGVEWEDVASSLTSAVTSGTTIAVDVASLRPITVSFACWSLTSLPKTPAVSTPL